MIVDPSTLLGTVILDYDKSNAQPNSYDLRTNTVYEICGGIKLYADGRKDLPQYKEIPPSQSGWYSLWPGHLYQLEFVETVEMPEELCAISVMRSSMAKSGASGEPGLYDSGYKGYCGMTVSVKHTCMIQKGAAVAQIIFMTAQTSKLYTGEYQDTRWARKLLERTQNE